MIVRPCEHCPFNPGQRAFLCPERGEEIWDALDSGGTFHCHETVADTGGDGSDQFCAGALLLMEEENEATGGAMANQMVRILTRIGSPPLDLDRLDTDAPHFERLSDWFAYLETPR